jgi:CTP:molybdopterin cytidylyltransferase MocA
MNKSATNISTIILAAGFSSRMGRFKPLMELGKKTVIDRVVSLYQDVGVKDISVVVGYRGEEIRKALASSGVRIVVNQDFEKGMYTSIIEGIRHLPASTGAFFINPVDIPLIRVPTIKILIRSSLEKSAWIFYPYFNGRRGHPPLIDGELAHEIIAWKKEGGLRSFLEERNDLALDVPVADEGVLSDLDTVEDFRLLQARLKEEGIPTPAECRMLMEEIQHLPESVITHCRVVAAMTKTLTDAVNRAGSKLDSKLVYAAALVHDIARMEEPHAQTGAKVLEEWGYPKPAEIVRVHVDIQIHDNEPINEAEIVYLADKLVSGNQPIDLEQRFHLKMKKYGQDPQMAAAIRLRWDNAHRIKDKVEQITGCPLRSISDQDILLKEDAP